MRFRLRNEKGQSMVETALVMPLLILVLFGIIDFGWLFYNKLSITNCAREGARYAAVHYEGSDISTDVGAKVNSVNPTSVPLSTNFNLGSGDYVEVTVSGDVPVLTPIIGAFFPGNVCAMTSTVTMYREKDATSST